jgi:hypothetical protein
MNFHDLTLERLDKVSAERERRACASLPISSCGPIECFKSMDNLKYLRINVIALNRNHLIDFTKRCLNLKLIL